MSKSYWQDLKKLPEGIRDNYLWVAATDLKETTSALCRYKTCTLEEINKAQQHLDRIKQLVLTRRKDENE